MFISDGQELEEEKENLGAHDLGKITTERNLRNFDDDGTSGNAGATVFIRILLHTLSCNVLCKEPSCHKMGLLLQHYRGCQQKRQSEARAKKITLEEKDEMVASRASHKCGLCLTLAKIVARHSVYQCKFLPNQTGCPVPMCDLMRKVRQTQEIEASTSMEE